MKKLVNYLNGLPTEVVELLEKNLPALERLIEMMILHRDLANSATMALLILDGESQDRSAVPKDLDLQIPPMLAVHAPPQHGGTGISSVRRRPLRQGSISQRVDPFERWFPTAKLEPSDVVRSRKKKNR